MKSKLSFYVSIIALLLSGGLIFVWCWNTSEMSVVDPSTFTATCTALITIAVTIAVGYQIYNVIDTSQKLAEIDKLKNTLHTAITEIQEFGYNSLTRSFEALAKATYSIESKAYEALL